MSEDESETGRPPAVDSGQVISPRDESYLPSWILDMRKKLEKSKTASTHADKQINGILQDVAGLTNKLNDANEETKQHQKILHEKNNGSLNKPAVSGLYNVLDLPDDTLCIILQFLPTQDVMSMESTRKEVRGMIEASHYWLASYFDQFKRFKASGQLNFRDFIVNKEQCIASALTFIRVLKEKRSVPRFRNIEPHCYRRSDTAVSHPFPIVEVTEALGPGQGQQSSISTTMMSRVETMNTDFRSFALLSMRDISELTSFESDVIHLKLVQCGAVAVLVSLLSSESDVLRQYSCESLANLLCWETRLILNYERFSYLHSQTSFMSSSPRNNNTLPPFSSGGLFLANPPLTHRSLRDQLQVCDARRQLSTLLTSPSACVNLAQSRSRGRDVNEQPKTSNGPAQNKMTSAVQGLSSKAACRVLINLFSASECLPSPQRNFVVFGESKGKASNTNKGENTKSDAQYSPKKSISTQLTASKSSIVKPTADIKRSKTNKRITGEGTGTVTDTDKGVIGGGQSSTKKHTTQRGTIRPHENSIKKSHSNPMSSPPPAPSKGHGTKSNSLKHMSTTTPIPPKPKAHVIPIIPSQPWNFLYYHKSGFVKSAHVVWIQFLAGETETEPQYQEMRGRGEDDTGLFFIKGYVNKDIEGYSWKLEKCYVKQPLRSKAATLHTSESPTAPQVALTAPITDDDVAVWESPADDTSSDAARDAWCRNETGEWIGKDEISEWGRPHISHTAYHSDTVTDAVITESFAGNQRVAALANLRQNVATTAGNMTEQPFREDRAYYESHDPQSASSGAKTSNSSTSSSTSSRERGGGKRGCSDYPNYVRFNTHWGRGLFGLWEVSTTEAHFELVKGGVFRAMPM